ncbi:MAG: hypothetical protein OEV64_06950 [Desulfobulbaceae bacterium]|nr:hypothetical protein [Desulfobulbaceae bacterium]
MAKKKLTGRKKALKKNEQDYNSLPISSVASRAHDEMENRNFAKAIELYRILVKREPEKNEWLGLVTSAYDARIEQLAAKGMVKEALAILNNKAGYLIEKRDSYTRLRLLLNSGAHKQAAEQYGKLAGDLERKQRGMVDELFAALLIAGKRDLLPLLPPDCPLVTHYGIVSRALRFWEENNPEKMEETLRGIPFTSPFKQLRLLLKGLAAQYSGLEKEEQEIFAKITESSPFYHVASLLSLQGRSNKVTDLLSHLKESGVTIPLKLLGISSKTADHFTRLEKALNDPHQFFNYLVNNRNTFGNDLAREICLKILPLTPDDIMVFSRFFVLPDTFEMARIEALSYETDGDIDNAVHFWTAACSLLKGEEENLTRALLHRHVAGLLREVDYEIEGLDEGEELEKSLRYDPDHKSTYLRLLEVYRNSGNKYRSLLEQALKSLPEDVDLLHIAVEDAISRNAQKKASTIAEKILRIDPINTKARDLLIKAHLNHGRKLFASGKYHLAQKEFTVALEKDRASGRGYGPLICLAMLELQQGDDTASGELLAQAINKGTNVPALRLRICAESRAAKISNEHIQQFDKDLRALRNLKPGHDDIFAMIREIKVSNITNRAIIADLFEVATGFVTKTSKLVYDEKEFISICSFFHQYELFKPLTKFAGSGCKLYPKNPWLIYYQLYGISEGGGKRLSSQQMRDLNSAGATAIAKGDFKLGKLLSELLFKVSSQARGMRNLSPRVLEKLIDEIVNSDSDLVDIFDDDDDDDDDKSRQLPIPF